MAGVGWSALISIPATVIFLGRLRAALRRNDPDLIHSNGSKAHVLAALARPRGVPLLWHLHDFPGQRPIMTRILRHLSCHAAAGIAISAAVRRDAEVALPGLPIVLVANSTDTERFIPAPRDGSGLDRLAGLAPAPRGTVRIGLVATYARWKGQDVFLDALSILIADKAPVRGFIVGGSVYATTGSGFTEAELRDRVAAQGLDGRVGFIGFQDDPADVYRMLDVVINASTRPEPFGLTIIEAMACGRPVVVAAGGGAAEVFTAGSDGVGHVPGDAADLARALAPLIADAGLRDRLGSNGRRTAVERYSQGRYGRELVAAYAHWSKAT